MRNEDVFEAVADALRRGEPSALVTIIRAQGSTPQRVGAKMLVFPDGRIVGTIGGGCYENEAFWKARTAIETRQPIIAKYELADDIAEDTGLICGGQMEVYIEPLEPAPALYLVGAGHVVVSPRPGRAHRRVQAPRHRRPREVCQHRAVSERRGDRRGLDSGVAHTRRAAPACVRGHPDSRPSARYGRPPRAGAETAEVSRTDREPRQGGAHLRGRSKPRASRPNS